MSEYPAWLRTFPEADLPVEGLRGWLLQGTDHLIILLEAEQETVVPEHAHGHQWGIVVDGEMDLSIAGDRRTYCRGESYFIPAGTPHGALLRKGLRILDLFADAHRYRSKVP